MLWCVFVAWCVVGSDVSSSLVWFLVEPNRAGRNMGNVVMEEDGKDQLD
jgi:hypothetical protein